MNEINSYFFSAFVKSVWDPLSTSQTKNLVQLCNNIFVKQTLSKNESSRAREVKAVVPRKGNSPTVCGFVCAPVGTENILLKLFGSDCFFVLFLYIKMI